MVWILVYMYCSVLTIYVAFLSAIYIWTPSFFSGTLFPLWKWKKKIDFLF